MSVAVQNRTFSFRVSDSLREEAFDVIKAYGFTPTQVLNLFLTEIANTRTIPVDLSYLSPSKDTLEAICEVRSGKAERHRLSDVNVSQLFGITDNLK